MPRAVAVALNHLTDLPALLQTAEGFDPLLAALREGRSGVVDGAWGSSAGLAAATLALLAPRTLLVVIAHPHDVDPWAGDLISFSGLRPVLFPACDDQTVSAQAVDESVGRRLRLLKQFDSGEPPRLVLTTIQALLQPVPPAPSSPAAVASSAAAKLWTWRKCPPGSSPTATRTRRPSNCPASSAVAAASSTFTRPTPRRRTAWNCSATTSTPSASFRRRRSAASANWNGRSGRPSAPWTANAERRTAIATAARIQTLRGGN